MIPSRRIFIAIPASEPLKDTFVQTLKKLKINADQKDIDVKWSPFENYHATLVFLGECDDARIENVKEIMGAISSQQEGFDLKIQNIDGFDDIHHARVLWLGMQNKNNLQKLRADLWANLNAEGFNLPEEDFTPHITIGRLRNPKSCKDLISPFVRKSFGTVHVDKIVLFESKLQSYFPVYTPIFETPFKSSDQSLT